MCYTFGKWIGLVNPFCSLLLKTRFVMVDYYKILKVSPKASPAEIKSAYRRLARKLHPDVNGNAEKSGEEFASIAGAYEVLSNPRQRAQFDNQLSNSSGSIHSTDSVFYSDNLHAQKLRQMAIERRYNEIVDQMIAEERKETFALQKIIFAMVALFVSTFFVGIFKPMFWSNSAVIGKIILLTLFVVGVLQLFRRLQAGFEKYTYDYENLHDSILQETPVATKPFSRFTAIAFLIIGMGISLVIGLLLGNYLETALYPMRSAIFSQTFRLEFIFYPPIVALLVDLMHNLALKFERQTHSA